MPRALANGLLGAALSVLAVVGCAAPAPTSLVPIDDSSSTGGGGAGGSDAGPGGAGGEAATLAAKDYYRDTVHQTLVLTCGSCHATTVNPAPDFLDPDPDTAYARMEGYPIPLIVAPDNSMLRLKGLHTGPAMPAALDTLVGEWLLMEAGERGLALGEPPTRGEEPTGVTLIQALDAFAECMRYEDWLESGMNLLPDQQTAGLGPCKGCHNAGTGGAWLDDNAEITFDRHKKFPYIMKLVTGTVDEKGAFADLAPAGRYVEKGSEACNNEPCHPDYVLAPAVADAITTFYAVTKVRYDQDACAEPGAPDM